MININGTRIKEDNIIAYWGAECSEGIIFCIFIQTDVNILKIHYSTALLRDAGLTALDTIFSVGV